MLAFCLIWSKLGAGQAGIRALVGQAVSRKWCFLAKLARFMIAYICSVLRRPKKGAAFVRRALLCLLSVALLLAQTSPAAWAIESEHLNGREEICGAADFKKTENHQFDEGTPARFEVSCKCTLGLADDPLAPPLPAANVLEHFDFSATRYETMAGFVGMGTNLYRATCRGPPPSFTPVITSLLFSGFDRDGSYRNLERFRS